MCICSWWYFRTSGVRVIGACFHLFLSALWHQPCSLWGITWCLEVTIAPSRCGTWRTWDLRLLPFAQTQPLIGKGSRLVRCKTASRDCRFWTSRGNSACFRKFWKIEKCIPQHLDILKGISQTSEPEMVFKIWITFLVDSFLSVDWYLFLVYKMLAKAH